MPRRADRIAGLIDASGELEALAREIQGEREIQVDEADIEDLVGRYHRWLAETLTLIPEEFHDRFRAEHDGSWISHKIKHFLGAPGQVNVIHQASPEEDHSGLVPYWQYPYETTFRGPLLTQRQILAEARQHFLGGTQSESVELVVQICRGFSDFLVPLGDRQQNRPSFVPEDEYDVQDFLHGLLRIFFDDVRPEDYSPEHAGARSRIDFVLKSEKIVVEAKMTRSGLTAAKVGEELIIDIERYRSHPDCEAIVALVYDPDRRIKNRRTLESDLSGERDGLSIHVIVSQ